jgi:coenzyme F420-reducing hydrogenase delta subunit
MAEPLVADVVVNICQHCVPDGARSLRQWKQAGGLVVVREIPCGGKVDVPYLLHALEAVRWGVCVVACPPDQCRLAEGSSRAEVRIRTVQQLLAEIGLEPERAELLHYSGEQSPEGLERAIRAAVERLHALGPSVLCAPGTHWPPRSSDRPDSRPEVPAPPHRAR